MRRIHADALIHGLGVGVLCLDIQPKSANIAGSSGVFLYEIIKLAVDTLPSSLGPYVHALYPPEPGVSPVAPFIGDHQPPDDAVVGLGNDIEPFSRISKYRLDTATQHIRVELFTLGLESHRLVELDQGISF